MSIPFIIILSLFLLLILVIGVAPLCLFVYSLFQDIRKYFEKGYPICWDDYLYLGALSLVWLFICSFGVVKTGSELYYKIHPELRPNPTRSVEMIIPQDARMNAEVIKDNTRIHLKDL